MVGLKDLLLTDGLKDIIPSNSSGAVFNCYYFSADFRTQALTFDCTDADRIFCQIKQK